MINIALDMMGGDHAPDVNAAGAEAALKSDKDLFLKLLGPASRVQEALSSWDEELKKRTEIIDAPEIIGTDEHPTLAIKRKRDSSIVRGMYLVKEGRADAFISAGSSGALLSGGQLIVGRIKGVLRPPLASLMPTAKGYSLFLDCGANMDAKPEWLMQYALMGDIYMKSVEGLSSPSLFLANVGPEEEKGNSLVKAANKLIRELDTIDYKGFIEFRDIPQGDADIVVADAFTGNAIIKTYEGVGKVLLNSVREVLYTSMLTKLGALLIMKPLKKKLSVFDASLSGGAMLLGLNGPVIKCHGNANALEISTSIAKAARFVRNNTQALIKESVEKYAEKVL